MKFKIKYLVFFIFAFVSCEDTMEYYYGIPMQPKFFEDKAWESNMNIFGIIRPDSAGKPLSFLFLEETFPTKGAIDRDYTLKNAQIQVISYAMNGERDTFSFVFHEDTLETQWTFPRYICNNLKVEAGTEFRLIAKSPGLPDITASTKMPFKPEIQSGSLKIEKDKISLIIEPDSLAFLYEIFLFSETSLTSKAVLSKNGQATLVEWKPAADDSWNEMIIYAFDKNMAKYMTTATSSFYSFNIYRPPVTTVDGGYGCFGSMNFTSLKLK
jgi:Fe-S cluster assembly iron-binding protein IscA